MELPASVRWHSRNCGGSRLGDITGRKHDWTPGRWYDLISSLKDECEWKRIAESPTYGRSSGPIQVLECCHFSQRLCDVESWHRRVSCASAFKSRQTDRFPERLTVVARSGAAVVRSCFGPRSLPSLCCQAYQCCSTSSSPLNSFTAAQLWACLQEHAQVCRLARTSPQGWLLGGNAAKP